MSADLDDSSPKAQPPNKKNTKQPPQKNIDDFWAAFQTKFPGKVHTILPQSKRVREKRKREPYGPIQSQPVSASYEKAVRECKAVVDKISKECRRVNQRYRDLHFDMEFDLQTRTYFCLDKLVRGPSDEYLRPRSVKRVNQIFDNPEFYIDGASPNDIKQGQDGDCWFLAGLSACTQRPDFINSVCVARDEKVGVYGFVFHRDGEWIHTVIDDRLYLIAADFDESYYEKIALLQLNSTDDAEESYTNFYQKGSKALYFAQCATENETWLPLIEKAYAKTHGDFGAIEGGWTGEAIEDLTEEGYSYEPDAAAHLTYRKNIHAGHAYSIMEAREIKGKRLVKLRNPWGFSEWKGAWSDGSAEWTPEWMELLNHRFGDDGIFWISFEDLLKKFSDFDRTRLFSDKDWKISQQWVSIDVDWSSEYNDTKFEIDIREPGRCVIVLSQLDHRYFWGLQGQYEFELQFRLEREGEEGYVVRSNTTYTMERSCSVDLILEAGKYSVIMKITASRDPTIETPEQVVRNLHAEKREKLLQVGLSYDLAHAKALVFETEEDKSLRKQQRRREKEFAKARAKKAKREEFWHNWDRLKRQMDRKRRQAERKEAHKRKKAEAKEAKGSGEKNEAEEAKASGEKDEAEETKVSGGKDEETKMQTSEESQKDKTESPSGPDVIPKVKVDNVDEAKSEGQEPNNIEIDSQKSRVTSTSSTLSGSPLDTENEKLKTTQALTDEQTKSPEGSVDNEGKANGTQELGNSQVSSDNDNGPSGQGDSASDTDSVVSWATSIDTKLDLDWNVGDTDSEASDSSSSESIDEDNQEIADDAWNAVCVVGLRVFSKEEATVNVVRPRNEETSLDVDDVSKSIADDKPVAEQAEVNRPSSDGKRPPLQDRKSFVEMSSRSGHLKLPIHGK